MVWFSEVVPVCVNSVQRQIAFFFFFFFFFVFAIPITAGYRRLLSSSLLWENKTTHKRLELPLLLKVTLFLFVPEIVKPENG